MAYAIIRTGGSQFRVAEGDTLDVDRLFDTFVEFNSRFPTEDLFRAGDVRLAHLRIVHRQRLVFDCRFRSRNADDFLGELFDGHLAWIADVDRLVEIAHRKPENSIDQVRYVTERASL